MKPKHFALAILTLGFVASCATLSPEQLTAYNAAGQGVIHGVIGDYKAVKALK